MNLEPGLFKKIIITIQQIKNWPLVIIDKLGLVSRIKYTTRSGLKFFARSKSTDINTMVAILSGTEYPEEFLAVKPNSVVVDLGANIGAFDLYFSKINKDIPFQGFAIEPDPENYVLLKRNLTLNKISSFDTLELAISAKNGETSFTADGRVNAYKLEPHETGKRVLSKKLSSFCQEHSLTRINLLKIDVEGAEYEIFGSDWGFVSKNVDKIILEYHNISEEKNRETILEKLSPAFKVTEISRTIKSGVLFCKNKL